MTGEKNRYSTVEKLGRFDDESLSTPRHDEMVIELLNKNTLFKVIPYFKDIAIQKPDLHIFSEWFFSVAYESGQIDGILTYRIINHEPLKDDELTSITTSLNEIITSQEYVSETNVYDFKRYIKELKEAGYYQNHIPEAYRKTMYRLNNYNCSEIIPIYLEETDDIKIIGEGSYDKRYYVPFKPYTKEDVANAWNRVLDEYSNKAKYFDFSDDISIKTEVPIHASNGFIIGYWDVVVLIGDGIKKHESVGSSFILSKYGECFFIEVKPKIDSFGKVMRQLNTYRDRYRDPKIILRTDDLRFKEAFEGQGIRVI